MLNGGFIVYDNLSQSPIISDFTFALCIITLFFNVAIFTEAAGLCSFKSDSLVDLFIILPFFVIGERDFACGVAPRQKLRLRPRGGVFVGSGTFGAVILRRKDEPSDILFDAEVCSVDFCVSVGVAYSF